MFYIEDGTKQLKFSIGKSISIYNFAIDWFEDNEDSPILIKEIENYVEENIDPDYLDSVDFIWDILAEEADKR